MSSPDYGEIRRFLDIRATMLGLDPEEIGIVTGSEGTATLRTSTLRALDAARTESDARLREARHAIVQASINLANDDTVAAHAEIERALAALSSSTGEPERARGVLGCDGFHGPDGVGCETPGHCASEPSR